MLQPSVVPAPVAPPPSPRTALPPAAMQGRAWIYQPVQPAQRVVPRAQQPREPAPKRAREETHARAHSDGPLVRPKRRCAQKSEAPGFYTSMVGTESEEEAERSADAGFRVDADA